VAQEVVSLPEISIWDLVWYQLLHCCPELGILRKVAADILCLFVEVEILGPGIVLVSSAVFHEVVGCGVDNVKLCVESRSVDHSFSVGIFALKQDGVVALLVGASCWWRDLDGVGEKVT